MDKKKLAWLVPVRTVIFPLIFIIGAAAVHKDLWDIGNWWSVTATLVNFLTIGLIIFAAKKSGQTYGEVIYFKRHSTKAKDIIKASLVIVFVGIGGMYAAGFICYGKIPYAAPMMIAPIPKVLAIVNVLLLPTTTAPAEDALYLGCGVNNIENKYAAVIVPAFFFSVQHCFIPTLFDAKYIVYRFLSFLPLTVILCCMYQKKRDPLPIMVGHAIIDIATVMWIPATSTVDGFYEKMLSM